MAEKKDKAQGGEGEGGKKSPQAQKNREKKASRWDLATCVKYAKRFDSVDAWAMGAPSCFKAATARGFIAKCTAHMTHKTATKTVAKPKVTAKAKAAPAAKKKIGKKSA